MPWSQELWHTERTHIMTHLDALISDVTELKTTVAGQGKRLDTVDTKLQQQRPLEVAPDPTGGRAELTVVSR